MLEIFAWIVGSIGAIIILSILLFGNKLPRQDDHGIVLVMAMGLCIIGMVLHELQVNHQ